MKLNRRSFLFGSASALGAVALAPYLEPITFQGEGYKLRKVSSIKAAGLGDGDNPIRVTVKWWPPRGSLADTYNLAVFDVAIHPRAAFTWWPPLGRELIFTDTSLMLLEATGCPSEVRIGGYDDGVWFEERYRFPGPHKERWVCDSNGSGPWLV